jgi:aryl-alcohol dehydrogenase-like predicted oxidoreductase
MTSLRKLGSSDLEVFPLALGGNVFGWTADEAQSFAVLDAYTAAGGNFVDTADVYSAWADGNQGGQPAPRVPRPVRRQHQGRRRRLPAAPRHRLHRPVLHALRQA